ncbi:MAG: hypothetical protein ACYCO9_05850 [Streptosporangiaceae bacterium]
MTPWFAMAVGLVTAASLSLVMPDTALTFPQATSRVCATDKCPAPSVHRARNAGARLPSGRARLAPARMPAASSVTPTPPPAPIATLHYGGLPNYAAAVRGAGHRFLALIVIVANARLTPWNLRFRLPGARITWIAGSVGWHADGAGTIVVRGAPMQWARSDARQARLVIFGIGRPRWPTDCVFDHVGCRFVALTRAERGGSGNPAPQSERQPHSR